MRSLGVLALLFTLAACGGGDDSSGPTAITTERGDTTYGLLAEETTCDEFVAMSGPERLKTLGYIDAVKNIQKPDRSLAQLADIIEENCGLDPELGDIALVSVLVNYQ